MPLKVQVIQSSMNDLPKIILRERRSGAAIGRHPWVFRSMIAKMDSGIADGELVSVYGGPEERWIAYGFYNSQSDIRIRLYSWNESEFPDESFFQRRLTDAIELRTKTLGLQEKTNGIRFIHSDGDFLSGLILDSFNSHAVLEISALPIFARREMIIDLIRKLLPLESLRIRISETAQKQEGIGELPEQLVFGPENPEIVITENQLRFQVQLDSGQKTGYFLDQRANRKFLSDLAKDKRVLDLCCYTGGFSLHAAAGGAKEVIGVDTSSPALQTAERNAELNSLSLRFAQEDCIRFCQSMKPFSFDIVVLDPPKLAPTRAAKEQALKKYYRMNLEALRLICSGGFLFTFSCSGSVGFWEFERMLGSAARKAGRDIQIIRKSGADADHPVSLQCPQSEYLKALLVRVF